LDRIIFVAITIAALVAVGVTTSIMNSVIPAYAQGQTSCGSFCFSGHYTLSVPQPGTAVQTFSGNIKEAGVGGTINGGGKATCINGNLVSAHGSPKFNALASNTVTC
jgi:hypothetical protein